MNMSAYVATLLWQQVNLCYSGLQCNLLLELPFSVVKRANLARLQPSVICSGSEKHAMEKQNESVLKLATQIHQMIPLEINSNC